MDTADGIVTRSRTRRAISVPATSLLSTHRTIPESAFTRYSKWTPYPTRSGQDRNAAHGRMLEHMQCKFCRHEEPFNTLRMQDHLFGCDASHEATQQATGEHGEIIWPRPDSPFRASVDEEIGAFLREADRIRIARYLKVEPLIQPLVAKLRKTWTEEWPKWQKLQQGQEAKVSEWRQSGQAEEAQQLAEAIRTLPTMHYSQYRMSVEVPLGYEEVTIQGLDPLRLRDTNQARWKELFDHDMEDLATVPRKELVILQQQYETSILELKSQHESWAHDQLASARTKLQEVRKQHQEAIGVLQAKNTLLESKITDAYNSTHTAVVERNAADSESKTSQVQLRKQKQAMKILHDKYVKANVNIISKNQYIDKLEDFFEGRRQQDLLRIEEKLREGFASTLKQQSQTDERELQVARARAARAKKDNRALRSQLQHLRASLDEAIAESQAQIADIEAHREGLCCLLVERFHVTDAAKPRPRLEEVEEDSLLPSRVQQISEHDAAAAELRMRMAALEKDNIALRAQLEEASVTRDAALTKSQARMDELEREKDEICSQHETSRAGLRRKLAILKQRSLRSPSSRKSV